MGAIRKIQGRDLVLFVEREPGRLTALACATSCVVSLAQEAIETAGVSAWDWREYIPGKKEWSMKSDGLLSVEVGSDFDLMTLLGKTVVVVCATVVRHLEDRHYTDFVPDGMLKRSGRAVVTSVEEAGELAGMAKYSISLTGTGELVPSLDTAALWGDGELWYDPPEWRELTTKKADNVRQI